MLKVDLEKLVKKQAEEIAMLKAANEGLAFEVATLKGLQEFEADFVEGSTIDDVSTTDDRMTFDPDTGTSTYPPMDRR